MYSAALKPLIAQKKWRGFNVSEVLTDTLGGASCEHVKNAIRNWCRSTPSEHDHYALLVGQFGDILMCNVHTDLDPEWTDDVYGSLRDDTLAHDIFVGRLSTIDAADLSRQITKILNYEDHPVSAPVSLRRRAAGRARGRLSGRAGHGAHEAVRGGAQLLPVLRGDPRSQQPSGSRPT